MFGDTYHEGVIFHLNLLEDDYHSIRRVLQAHISDEARTDQILEAYGITADSPQEEFLAHVEHMCGDAIFKIPNYVLAQTAKESSFLYHFDQRSRLQNAFEGTAYHAHELLYLFMNLENEFNEEEKQMAREFSSAWIRFANGMAPWNVESADRAWMVWGPASKVELKNETQDQETRDYKRINMVLLLDEGRLCEKWLAGVDALVNRRWKLFGEA
jgi:carboxylesterase type B